MILRWLLHRMGVRSPSHEMLNMKCCGGTDVSISESFMRGIEADRR